jgi:hypothetical protein
MFYQNGPLMTILMANDTWHKCDTREMCHTVTQCETRTQNSQKIQNLENLSIGKWNSCDTLWHYDTSVKPKVFKLIGSFKDGRRHGRGTYLFFFLLLFPVYIVENSNVVRPLLFAVTRENVYLNQIKFLFIYDYVLKMWFIRIYYIVGLCTTWRC